MFRKLIRRWLGITDMEIVVSKMLSDVYQMPGRSPEKGREMYEALKKEPEHVNLSGAKL